MGKKFGFSWSWKRASGISGMKNKISQQIGVPLTKQGRQRKVGRAMGCSISFLMLMTSTLLIVLIFIFYK